MNNLILHVALLWVLMLTGCSSMSQQLHSESGLYEETLSHETKLSLDGFYAAPEVDTLTVPETGRIYIAPLGTEVLSSDDAELLPSMQRHMNDYLKAETARTLAEICPDGAWTLTDNPEEATAAIETALVRFRAQKPVLRWFATLAGKAEPLPPVSTGVKSYAEGDICLECVVRRARDGKVLFALKDSNRASAWFYEKEAYTREGPAELNLRVWAKKIARILYAPEAMREAGCSFGDLIRRRSLSDTAKAYWE